jgi:ZIP family zinc transporter
MFEAGLWGLVGASSLLIGAAIGARARLGEHAIGIILAFGAGTLVSAVAFELTEEAFALGGADVVAGGLALGGLAYFAGTVALARRGAADRMQATDRSSDESSSALLLGAVLDGIPESAVIGISLLEGGEVGIPILAAVFLSNLPEAISSSKGMCDQGVGLRTVLVRWTVVALVCAASAAAGYGLLEGASDELLGLLQAFAGGAVLTMLADTMFPEAYRLTRGGGKDPHPVIQKAIGLATVLGFAVAYLLSMLE